MTKYASQSGIGPHINCYKVEFSHINRKKVLKLEVCKMFFTRHCIMGCPELDLAFDNSPNEGM